MHADLLIIGVGIHETKVGMPCYGIYQLVDPWNGKAILQTRLIQINKIHIYHSLFVGLFHQNRIRKLGRVHQLLNEPRIL